MVELLSLGLFIVVLIMLASAAWVMYYLLVTLPEQQDSILQRYAPCVVNQVSLEYATLPSVQQKRIAAEKMREIFQGLGTILPGDAMIEAAIGDALYKRKEYTDDWWMEELKADQLAQTPTVKTPVPPRRELIL